MKGQATSLLPPISFVPSEAVGNADQQRAARAISSQLTGLRLRLTTGLTPVSFGRRRTCENPSLRSAAANVALASAYLPVSTDLLYWL